MRKRLSNNRICIALLLCLMLMLVSMMCMFLFSSAYARVENTTSTTVYYPGKEQEKIWSFTDTNSSYTPITDYSMPDRSETKSIKMLRQDVTDKVYVFSFSFPENATKAVISFGSGMFAADTCFSINGESAYLLNQAGYLDVYKDDSTISDRLILLDLTDSYTESSDSLYVDFYNADAYIGTANCDITASDIGAWTLTCESGNPILKPQVNEDGTTDYTSLSWSAAGQITDTQYEASLYKMSDGAYVPLIDQSLSVFITEDATATTDVITVATSTNTKAGAGAYWLSITQVYENSTGETITLDAVKIPFFVNYR